MIRLHLEKDRGKGDIVEPETMLPQTLRWCAGGSYLDLAWMHGVHRSTFYECVLRTLDAIDKTIQIGFDIESEQKKMRELAKAFERRAKQKHVCKDALVR